MRNVLRGKQDRLSRSRASFGALPAMYHHRHGEGRAHPFSHHSPSPGPGTLRQILALQNRSMEETDEKILALLKKLGLAHPLTPGDLDSEQDWSTLLSPQRTKARCTCKRDYRSSILYSAEKADAIFGHELLPDIVGLLAERGIACVNFAEQGAPRAAYDAVLEYRSDGSWKWIDQNRKE